MSSRFSKRIFAMLLEKGKGSRSWRQFSLDAGISYVQMLKLAQGEQENPPPPKLIRKVAAASESVTLEDYFFAVGSGTETAPSAHHTRSETNNRFCEIYRSLGSKQRRVIESFAEFLATTTQSEEKD